LREYSPIDQSSRCEIDVNLLQHHRLLVLVSRFLRRCQELASNIGFFSIGLTKHFDFLWKENRKKLKLKKDKKIKEKMAIFHFPKFEYEIFWRYFERLNAFLAQYGHCVGKCEILDIIDEDVNSKTRVLLEFWVSVLKVLMRHIICLSGMPGIHLSLKRLVMSLDVHFPILAHSIPYLIMSLFGVICVALLTMKRIRVPIMHAMINLT